LLPYFLTISRDQDGHWSPKRDVTDAARLRHYSYFLNSIAEKSLCFGPGILQDGWECWQMPGELQEI